ncbi:MAG: DNA methyltransferase [Candidatus Bathyarchaeota archaeon]|nr:DNA methyltransferase [Candidatus Bathyarchaeota archaeon]
MKFQKSFFRFESFENLANDTILFFTKSRWPNGEPSRVLLLSKQEVDAFSQMHLGDRVIENKFGYTSYRDLLEKLRSELKQESRYDFVLVDFRQLIKSERDFAIFREEIGEEMSEILRAIVVPRRYLGLLTDFPGPSSTAYPIPWFLAVLLRKKLRLRDEKVGLCDFNGKVYYLLLLQSKDDRRVPYYSRIQTAPYPHDVPAWVFVKSPPRKKNEIYHPAKFPEALVQRFIGIFTRRGDLVFDPMVGTGSSLIAAARMDRKAVGIDIVEEFVDIAKERLSREVLTQLDEWVYGKNKRPQIEVLKGDATRLLDDSRLTDRVFDYCITSPPYWSVLRNRGSEYQKSRRTKKLPQFYSQEERDLGNIDDYDKFLDVLSSVYNQVANLLKPQGHLTVILKNVKRNHVVYPIAWDLSMRLCGKSGEYDYSGNTLWCQDDIKIRPFALGIHWVSNTLHNYCLHFGRRGT